jgi:cyclopropane fatty-acyl-phospholipid synthase-like methyltransferase
VLARLAQGGTILDIGTGAGFALVHYATRFPRARVIGLEIDPPSIELAKTAVAEAGLSHRIEIRDGDANFLKDESVYDLVTMNVTLHETGGPAAYRRVLSRVYHALKPGGTLLVSELPYPDELTEYREEWVYKVLSGLQFHEALVGCGMITKGELRGLLKGADFANVRVASQPNPARIMILAERPNG